jgi:hypothetical protein
MVVAFGVASLAPVSALGQDGTAAGGTRVGVEGSVVTITVTIDMMYGGVGTKVVPEGAQEAADGLAAGIEGYWNQGLARYSSDCLELRIDVVITVLPNDFPPLQLVDLGEDRELTFVTEPGHHVVFYAEGDAYGNIPPPETYDPFDEDGVAPPGEDYGSPFEHDIYAIWSPHLEDARDFAHEFGHLLGLGDDYDASGDALPGRDGTLMADGDFLDENLASRLTDLARNASDEVPECETWQATIHLQANQPVDPYTCEQVGDAEGTLLVAADGRISGTLDAVETESCTFGFDRTRSGLTLELEGTASDSALTVNHTGATTTGYFVLGFFTPEGTLDPVPVPITAPGVAEGSVTREMPNDYTITLTFDFRCLTCEGDAVA